jgi:hypothetical protein
MHGSISSIKSVVLFDTSSKKALLQMFRMSGILLPRHLYVFKVRFISNGELREISGSHGGEYEDDSLLGYCVV